MTSNLANIGKWQTLVEPAKLFFRKENSMHIRSLLALGLMLAHTCVLAQAADTPPLLSPDDARAQRVRGKTLKDEAQKTYEAERAACQSKAIAISCMSSAKEKRIEAVRRGETMEREGRKAEREIHRLEVEAKAAKRAAEAPAEEAKQQADVERYREKEAKRAVERERSRVEESAKLEKRRSKLAAEQAARNKKQEERRKEDAKRLAAAPANARKKADRERQHAELVKKIDERARNYAELLKRREAEEAARQGAAATTSSR